MMSLFGSFFSKHKNDEIDQKVNQSLVEYVYSHSVISQVTSLFCATIVLIGLYSIPNKTYLFAWYDTVLVVVVFRLLSLLIYRNQNIDNANIKFWRYLFIMGAILGGITWGLLGLLLFPLMNSLQQTLSILVLAGVTAGATTSLSAILSASICYLTLAILPFIVQISLLNRFMYNLFDITLSVYLMYLVVLCFKMHYMIMSVIKLKFENIDLVKSLQYMATHDQLTQADNSNLFNINLSNAIKRSDRDTTLLALLFIDIDHFKLVNDTYGHNTGDCLLRIIVKKIKKALRSTDLIARVGGDEFTVILENIGDRSKILAIVNKIANEMSEAILIQECEIHVTLSIGVSIYPLDGQDAESLIRSADKAMYYVKQHGHNNVHFSTDFYNV